MLSVFNVWQIGIITAGMIHRAQNGFDLERRFLKSFMHLSLREICC